MLLNRLGYVFTSSAQLDRPAKWHFHLQMCRFPRATHSSQCIWHTCISFPRSTPSQLSIFLTSQANEAWHVTVSSTFFSFPNMLFNQYQSPKGCKKGECFFSRLVHFQLDSCTTLSGHIWSNKPPQLDICGKNSSSLKCPKFRKLGCNGPHFYTLFSLLPLQPLKTLL